MDACDWSLIYKNVYGSDRSLAGTLLPSGTRRDAKDGLSRRTPVSGAKCNGPATRAVLKVAGCAKYKRC